MTNQEAIQHLENMKWLKGYSNTTVDGKPLGEVIDEIIGILQAQIEFDVVYDGDLDMTLCGKCGAKMDGERRDKDAAD